VAGVWSSSVVCNCLSCLLVSLFLDLFFSAEVYLDFLLHLTHSKMANSKTIPKTTSKAIPTTDENISAAKLINDTQQINEKGWRVVQSKRSRREVKKQTTIQPHTTRQNTHNEASRSHPPPTESMTMQQAFNEERCFWCLAKGHRRAQCRDSLRCFKCKRVDHNIKYCRYKHQQARQTKRPPEKL
jgi:hypothetical protein